MGQADMEANQEVEDAANDTEATEDHEEVNANYGAGYAGNENYGAGYSNWACLALHLIYPFKEIAIVGNNVNEKFHELYKRGITNAIFAVHAGASELPLTKDRFVADKTLFYVCENKTCKLPVSSVEETVNLLA